MDVQERILKVIFYSNWAVISTVSIAAVILGGVDFTLGVVIGGLMVTLNFHLMYRSLKKSFNRTRLPSLKSILVRHYFRFGLSIVFIFFLISKRWADTGGLLIGLSVVVISIMIAALCELKNIIIKEAR